LAGEAEALPAFLDGDEAEPSAAEPEADNDRDGEPDRDIAA